MVAGSKPTGVLPLTLPASEEVIAVYQNGDCVSRNDVPGYEGQVFARRTQLCL